MKLLITVLLFLFITNAKAVTRYVTPAGAGLQNGSSWANAFPGSSLQAAINASAPGDEVWVAAGTYFTTTLASRSIYFSMRNGVAILGSFNGTETALSQRVFSCGFTSVLSAEIGVPGIADNSYHVISNSSLNNTAVLDGFTITGGNANFDVAGNDSRSHGGGMLNLAPNGGLCSPTINNCLFTGNTAVFGGGMFNNGFNTGNANPVLLNCIFAANNATIGGGGMDNFGYGGNASPALTNCIFYNNTAVQRAGAMYCWGGGNGNVSPLILHTVFVGNTAADGGGIVSDRTNTGPGNSGTANPQIRNSIFYGNTASGAGPQFYILGGAEFTLSYSIIDMSGQNPPHLITGPGTGNILSAPVFLDMADADGTDNCWLTPDDGLQLQLSSPGVDAGDPSGLPATDIRNYPRVMNGAADMGGYEFFISALPVTWLDFYGSTNGDNNELTWTAVTGSEHRSYEVQRSSDGITYSRIGELTDAFPPGMARQYRYTDRDVKHNRYYYRIRQNDADGTFSLSSVVMLYNPFASSTIGLYPNPATDRITIQLPGNLQAAELVLFHADGRQLKRFRANGSIITLPLGTLPAGNYYLYCSTLRTGAWLTRQ